MLKNAARVRVRLKAVWPELEAGAEALVLQAARAAQAEAASLAPVDTGRLKESIRVKGQGLSASVATDCPYAPAVELGSSRSAARPFMTPAADGQRAAFVRAARRLGGDGR